MLYLGIIGPLPIPFSCFPASPSLFPSLLLSFFLLLPPSIALLHPSILLLSVYASIPFSLSLSLALPRYLSFSLPFLLYYSLLYLYPSSSRSFSLLPIYPFQFPLLPPSHSTLECLRTSRWTTTPLVTCSPHDLRPWRDPRPGHDSRPWYDSRPWHDPGP